MSKQRHHRTDEEIQTNRIMFIKTSRECAMQAIAREIKKLDTEEFSMRLYQGKPEDNMEGMPVDYCLVDVCHKEGPHVYRAKHPVSLAYPDGVYGSLVRTILRIAKDGGSACTN